MLNVAALVGRLVADPELKYTPSGVAVCSFRIAVDRRFKSEGSENQADFINIVAWRQSAEFVANYMTKGRLVAVQGRIQTRTWVQQDGQKRYAVEIVAENVQGLDRPRDAQSAGQGAPSTDDQAPSAPPAAVEAEADMDYDPFAEE